MSDRQEYRKLCMYEMERRRVLELKVMSLRGRMKYGLTSERLRLEELQETHRDLQGQATSLEAQMTKHHARYDKKDRLLEKGVARACSLMRQLHELRKDVREAGDGVCELAMCNSKMEEYQANIEQYDREMVELDSFMVDTKAQIRSTIERAEVEGRNGLLCLDHISSLLETTMTENDKEMDRDASKQAINELLCLIPEYDEVDRREKERLEAGLIHIVTYPTVVEYCATREIEDFRSKRETVFNSNKALVEARIQSAMDTHVSLERELNELRAKHDKLAKRVSDTAREEVARVATITKNKTNTTFSPRSTKSR